MHFFRFTNGQRESRLLGYGPGPEAMPRGFQSPEMAANLPPEIAPRYGQSLYRLQSTIQGVRRLGINASQQQMMAMYGYPGSSSRLVGQLRPYAFPAQGISRFTFNSMQSPTNRLPWRFVPSGWHQNQPAFVPGVGLATVPYGVPPAFNQMMYQSVPYPLPQSSYRLPDAPRSTLRLPNVLDRDQRAALVANSRQSLFSPLEPAFSPTSLPRNPAPLPPSADRFDAEGVTFDYAGPPQPVTIAFNGQLVSLPTLPADGQTMVDPRGFTVTRRGNRYSIASQS